jgi:predicted O-methyltransferase YrrM
MQIIKKPHDYRSNYNHLRGLVDMILDFPQSMKRETMVEIGAGTGDSTEIFSMFFDKVISIDPMLNTTDGVNTQAVCRAILEQKIKGKNVLTIFDYSHNAVHQLKYTGPIKMVYIDGDHSYPFVRRDIQLYWPLIAEDGFLCGHDYGVTIPGQDGVKQAVAECFGGPDCLYIDTSWVIQKTAGRKILC